MIRFDGPAFAQAYSNRKFRCYEWFMADEHPTEDDRYIFIVVMARVNEVIEGRQIDNYTILCWENAKFENGKYYMYVFNADNQDYEYEEMAEEDILFWTSDNHRAFPSRVFYSYSQNGTILNMDWREVESLCEINEFDREAIRKEKARLSYVKEES